MPDYDTWKTTNTTRFPEVPPPAGSPAGTPNGTSFPPATWNAYVTAQYVYDLDRNGNGKILYGLGRLGAGTANPNANVAVHAYGSAQWSGINMRCAAAIDGPGNNALAFLSVGHDKPWSIFYNNVGSSDHRLCFGWAPELGDTSSAVTVALSLLQTGHMIFTGTPTAANDAAAAALATPVPVGASYWDNSGFLRKRLS